MAKPPTDHRIKSLLAMIRQCDVDAIGVLADLLEELGDERAETVRTIYQNWLERQPVAAAMWPRHGLFALSNLIRNCVQVTFYTMTPPGGINYLALSDRSIKTAQRMLWNNKEKS